MPYEPSSITREDWGRLQVVVNDQDVTFFRGVPAQVQGWSIGEPFGDSHCSIFFPQVTSFEEFGTGDLAWLIDDANVEVYHVLPDGVTVDTDNPIFEGMIADFSDEVSETSAGVGIECIGALYQLDYYRRAPLFVPDEARTEARIKAQFSHGTRPALRTQELTYAFPDWWGDPVDDPNADAHTTDDGGNITGFATQHTGDWDNALTGYVQELLSYMQEPDDGVHGRIAWTVRQDPGRKPALRVKDLLGIDWTVAVGAPGVGHKLHRDLSQAPNVIYGEGTDQAGTKWRHAFLNDDGSMTSYRPLGILDEVSQYEPDTLHEANTPNPDFDPARVRREVHQNFGVGVSLARAIEQAQRQVETESDPGWFGTLTLNVDPQQGSRFEIRAGENIRLRHFRGQGSTGVILHIAQVEVDWTSGTVTLTVDTKGRDLLTLIEMLERKARDNKTPAQRLRIGRESGQTSDERAPWDVYAGAGMLPRESTDAQLANLEVGTDYTPTTNPERFLRVDADAVSARGRWGFAPVIVQEYGNIRLVDIRGYDAAGNLVAKPFHVGVYGNWLGGNLTVDFMPLDSNGVPNPFTDGVFDEPDNIDPSNIVLWGRFEQRAGYWPGLESGGDAATGILRDGGGFDYRTTDGHVFWVAIYCEHSVDVYFQGRFWKGSE